MPSFLRNKFTALIWLNIALAVLSVLVAAEVLATSNKLAHGYDLNKVTTLLKSNDAQPHLQEIGLDLAVTVDNRIKSQISHDHKTALWSGVVLVAALANLMGLVLLNRSANPSFSLGQAGARIKE